MQAQTNQLMPPNCPVHVAVQMVFVLARPNRKYRHHKHAPVGINEGEKNEVKHRPGIYPRLCIWHRQGVN